MSTIREFDYTASDYQAVADLFAAISGNDHYRSEDIQHMDKIRGQEIPFARFVAETGGTIIAEGSYCQSLWFQIPYKLSLNIAVHPEIEWSDLRKKMYAHLVKEASRHDPETFSVRLIEDDHDEIRFWKQNGFQQIRREPRFALDLIKFDPTPFDATIPDIESQGIEIRTLAELKSCDPDWLLKWWQMEWLILQDLAKDEELAVRRTLAQFEEDVQHPAIIPEAFFFALDGEGYVAITGLTRYVENAYMADLTWAIPSYQDRGIELSLKLKAIKWAKDRGAVYIVDEAVEDDPVYPINLALGFEHLPAWLVLVKQINQPT